MLADSHASTRMKIVPGGVGMVYAPNDLGYPVGEPVDPDWVSDCDLFPGLCVTDPKRIKRTWTQDGSDMFGTEVGTPVQEELVVFCDMIPGVCNVAIEPIRDIASAELLAPMFSVVRTGAGDLGAAAVRRSAHGHALWLLYGGHAIGGVAPRRRQRSVCAAARQAHLRSREGAERASLLGPQQDDYSAANGAYRAWYPERGGNVDIVVGGSVSGDAWTEFAPPNRPQTPSASVGNWLWRQGSDALPASWWINFGAYAVPMATNMWASSHPYIVGFTGFGTLGGGNLSIAAGGDAGIVAARGLGDYGAPEPRSRALVAVVGGTVRVASDGSLVLTGGGDLRLRLGGALNPDLDASQYATQYRTNRQKPDLDGMVTNLRGAIQIEARAIGGSRQLFRRDAVAQPGLTGDAMDPRPINPFVPTLSSASGGITLVPGDSAVYLETLGDLVLSGVSDAGRARPEYLHPDAGQWPVGRRRPELVLAVDAGHCHQPAERRRQRHAGHLAEP
ncbi:hypothetical protein WJ968_04485 [Achromobacter xylosoxidans]